MACTIDDKVVDIITKVLTVLVALYLTFCGCWRFTYSDEPAIYYILAIYFIIFAILMVIGVFRVTKVTDYFSFMDNGIGLGFFVLFVAFLLFDWDVPIEFGCSISLFVDTLFNWCVGCRGTGAAKQEKI